MVNNQDIALWYFDSKHNSREQDSFDSTAPSSLQTVDSKCYFFDGHKSFFQIPYNYFKTRNGGFGVTFQFLTLQKNALIMLYGKTNKRFVALEVRDGYTTFTYNLEFPDGPKTHVFNQVYLPETDLQNEYIICRIGVIGNIVGIALIDKKQRTHTFKLPNIKSNQIAIQSDLYFGGVYDGDINHYIKEFKPFVKNIDMRLRGRVYQPINVNIKDFDPGTPEFYQNIGMWPGCGRDQDVYMVDLSPQIKENPTGSIAVTRPALKSMNNIEGFVSFTTADPNGDILTIVGRTGKTLKLIVEEGFVKLDDGKTSLSTTSTYGDSRKHHVYFMRSKTEMKLAVDDRDNKAKKSLTPLSSADKESVEVLIGGDFAGCVATPYFIGDMLPRDQGYSSGSLVNMRCSTRSSSECQHKPDFNQCSIRPAQSILMRTIAGGSNQGLHRSPKRAGGRLKKNRRNGKNRKRMGGHRHRKGGINKLNRKNNKKRGSKSRRQGRQSSRRQRVAESRFNRRTRKWFSMLA